MLLLGLWLPATLHCGIEQTGWLRGMLECDSRADDAGHGESECARDVCAVVEGGVYRVDLAELHVPAPETTGVLPWVTVFDFRPAEPANPCGWKSSAVAEDWSVLWRVLERVMPPVRAPDSLA